ncbi:MAG: hypothetical protein IKD27_08090 [Oscillospiraceae bacterium]|nr:hypothetical protein [Oscillospiraceae bacterium]
MDSNVNEQNKTDSAAEENFQEKLCSGSFKVSVLSDNGFDLLKEKGLL